MYHYLRAVIGISNKDTDVVMGVLPPNCIVLNPFLSVSTAFNSGGGDTLIVGHGSNDDAYGESKSIASLITLADFTAGAELGILQAGKKVLLHYASSGSAPTTGKAVVILPFLIIPKL